MGENTVSCAGPMIIPQERQRMSVIGFRDASDPCLAGARTLAKFLAENGVVAVGGLARGLAPWCIQSRWDMAGPWR